MNGAVTAAKMEPRGSSVSPLRTRKRSRTLGLRKTTHGSRSGRSNGRAECREKKIGIEPKGSTFFLTFPLIGQCYTAAPYLVDFQGGRSFQEPQPRRFQELHHLIISILLDAYMQCIYTMIVDVTL